MKWQLIARKNKGCCHDEKDFCNQCLGLGRKRMYGRRCEHIVELYDNGCQQLASGIQHSNCQLDRFGIQQFGAKQYSTQQ